MSATKIGRPPLPQGEKKVFFGFKCSAELISQLDMVAEQDERSRSFMVCKAIEFYLAHRQPIETKNKVTALSA